MSDGKKLKKSLLYNRAKKLGFEGPYVGTTNVELKTFLDDRKDSSNTIISKPKPKPKKRTNRSILQEVAKQVGFTGSLRSATNDTLKKFIIDEVKAEENDERLQNYIEDDTNEDEFDVSDININDLLNKLRTLNFKRDTLHYFLNIDGHIFTLSQNYLNRATDVLVIDEEFKYGSDTADLEQYRLNNPNGRIFLSKEFKRVKKIPGQAFLPYTLTREVLDSDDESHKYLRDMWYRYTPHEDGSIDCVGNSIKIAEQEKIIPNGSFDKYVSFKLNNLSGYSVRQKDFRYIADLLKIHIVLHDITSCDKKSKSDVLYYGDKSHPKLELYSYLEHAFLYETTKFTNWSLINGYSKEHVINLKDKKYPIYKYIYEDNRYRISEKKSNSSSLNFIKLTIANPYITEPMSQAKILDQINYKFKIDHTSDIDSGFGEPNKRNQSKPLQAKSPFFASKDNNGQPILGSDSYDDRIYADFESYNEGNLHVGDMLVTLYKNKIRTYLTYEYEDSPAEQFLKDISNNVYGNKKNHLVIFHNLGYDFNFIAKVPGLAIGNRLATSSSKLKCCNTYYFNKTIYFKDSYSVIPTKLSSFSQTFGFPEAKKGACPYGYYNKHTIMQKYAYIEDTIPYVKSGDLEDFLSSVKDYLHPTDNTKFDHNKHRLDYCIQDVHILAKGYIEFRNWVKEFGEELDFIVSIPQLAFHHIYNEGALDNICPVSGVTQAYLQNFIVGGRCMSANNEKYIAHEVADFDANSLYPSAMCRSDFMVPEGPGRKISEEELESFDLNDYQCAYLTINILSVGINNRDFPVIYIKGRGNVNDPQPEEICYATKTTIEDMIKYHNITYQVLGGLVWDLSAKNNTKLADVITNLYNKRVQLKKEGKKSQELVKLIMNAAYGRMIMKPHDTDEKWFTKYKEGEQNHKKYKEFTHRHYDHVKDIALMEGMVCITKYKSILEHSNYAHIGINVLDISKRIMNEVMCLAEDNDIKIYYQDTDSMHMLDSDIPKLESLFRYKYGRELAGKSLQQFSSDFEAPKGYEKAISKTCIIVGKKCYIDIIESSGISNPEDKHIDEHIRMKGIPLAAINEKSKFLGISNEEMYRRLYKGEEMEFNMLADGGVSFKFDKFNITSLTKFTRKLQF